MKNIKVIMLTLLSGLLILSGCKRDYKKDSKDELTIFAAASLTESLNEIKETYEMENPGKNLIINFDSSGTLKSQIEQNAKCDIFISASSDKMDKLDKSKKAYNSRVSIDPKTRFNLVENELVLAKKKGSKLDISDFDDLAKSKVKSIALGNSDVPVGAYSKILLKNIGILSKVEDKISYGSNVKEVTTWINEGASDCGIIYITDARVANLEVVTRASREILDKDIIYPAAIMESSTNKDMAKKFLNFLKSDYSKKVFKKYGFKLG